MRKYPIIIVMILMFHFLSSCKEDTGGTYEMKKYVDVETGNEVWQVTDHDSSSVAFYFERQLFTRDDRFALFVSKRTGEWQIYRADLETGKTKQISENFTGHPFNPTMHPDGKRVCYMDGWALVARDVASLKKDTLMDYTGHFEKRPGFAGTFTNDGRYTLISYRSDTCNHVLRVDLFNNSVEEAFTWCKGGMSHALINPENPDLITFVPGPDKQNNMSLPMEERARTWIVNVKTGEIKRFLTMPYGYRATHETWSFDGSEFFHYKKTQPGWIPTTIASLSLDGETYTEYYTNDTIRLGHGISSEDGKWFISDGQDPDWNPLILINLEKKEGRIISWANATITLGHKNFAHVHPTFSSSGNYVIYTSDRTGTPQVYIVPIKEIKENW